MTVTLRPRLEAFLRARLPDARDVRIVALERSTEGFSQETFSFEAEIDRGVRVERRAYVAKREPEAGLLEPYDLEPEFRVLHALQELGLPSPPTPWFERDPAVLERAFYVMERLPGEVPVPAARADGTPPLGDAERAALAPQVVGALAALHAVDWRTRGLGFLDPPAPGVDAALREVARWEARIARSALPVPPALAEALAWLRVNAPVVPEITLVHGDFRLGNWLVEGHGAAARLAGVLDWEMVHLGDPLEDLAWCRSLLWRAGTPFASCLALPDELSAAYARATGRLADGPRLRFWEVLAVVKMSAIMLTGIRAFLDGRSPDLRMAIFDHQLPFLMAGLAVLRGFLPAPA